jgi:kynureninase
MPSTELAGLRREAETLDAADGLAGLRDSFHLPQGKIYLDGNSLGALPKGAEGRLLVTLRQEWGDNLIASWNTAGWFVKPQVVGDRIGRLIGAKAGEVIALDSTSLNIFKVVCAALRLRPARRVFVSEASNFPTDIYMLQGIRDLLGDIEIRIATPDRPLATLLDGAGVVLLTHVDFRSGAFHDMAAVTAEVQAAGALMIWDLAHSAGALVVDLTAAKADFAVGCGYKYLNGGPGAPAFVYCPKRHQPHVRQPLTGWLGHSDPFAFSLDYAPDAGIRAFQCGTPPILSYAALEASLDIWDRTSMQAVRAKSVQLTRYFIACVDAYAARYDLALASPRDERVRGSQVSWSHPEGFRIMKALISRGVVGDFRAPDILRFGLTPLYTSFDEVWRAADILRDILETGDWRRFAGERDGPTT